MILGFIGPFGTYDAAPAEIRIPYWIANICLGYAVLSVFARTSLRAAARFQAPPWAALLLGVGVGALPVTVLVAVLSALLIPALRGHGEAWLARYGECLAIAEPFAFGFSYLRLKTPEPLRGAAEPAAAGPAAVVPGAGSLLERLPRRLGRELLYLEMEDHYVRAHTRLGSDLILMPMREAVAGLSDVEGLQVHRSYWVARGAVAAPVREGRNLALELVTGQRIPVSRASVAKLKAAGWPEPEEDGLERDRSSPA